METVALETWKVFLRARILQEEGKDAEAIQLFDQVLAVEPQNPHFLNAKAFALMRLGRPAAEAMALNIRRDYAVLAKTYVGDADKPGPWIEGLKELLNRADKFTTMAPPAAAAAVAAVW